MYSFQSADHRASESPHSWMKHKGKRQLASGAPDKVAMMIHFWRELDYKQPRWRPSQGHQSWTRSNKRRDFQTYVSFRLWNMYILIECPDQRFIILQDFGEITKIDKDLSSRQERKNIYHDVYQIHYPNISTDILQSLHMTEMKVVFMVFRNVFLSCKEKNKKFLGWYMVLVPCQL